MSRRAVRRLIRGKAAIALGVGLTSVRPAEQTPPATGQEIDCWSRRTRRVRAAICAGLLGISIGLVGCGGENEPPSTSTTTAKGSPTTSTAVAQSKLVGEWQRITTCSERLHALTQVGLQRFAAEQVADEGWVPGVTKPEQIKDPSHPCNRAVPLKHEHFFTADGAFGSRDDTGNQVDDGTYRLTNPTTVVISKEFGDVTFHFTADDKTLTLDPVIPDCVKSGCFAAQWAVSMAYPGLKWNRTN